MLVREEDFSKAVQVIVNGLPGIEELYTSQIDLLKCLVEGNNIFLISPTNSGKTLPPIILPSLLSVLNEMGYKEMPIDAKAAQPISQDKIRN